MRCSSRRSQVGALAFLFAAVVVSGGPSAAHALPFNKDLNKTSMLRTGSSMRQKPPGSVPAGSLPYRYKDEASVQNNVNPLKGNALSTANGERLYNVNCAPCHGYYSDPASKERINTTIPQMMISPDITADAYKERSDGFFFGTIHYGGMAIMPAYGWKLSETEHWDIVNYIRKIQGR